MFEDIMTNKKMAIGVMFMQLVLLFLIIIQGNWVLSLVALLSFLVAATIWRFGYVIKPMLCRQAHVVEGFGSYEIPPSQDVIIKKNGSRYYATAYLMVNFSQSSTEKTPEQLALTRQSYERAVSSLNYVYKLSNMVCPVDLKAHVDVLKERRGKAETRLSELLSLPPSANQAAEISKLRREIESYDTQLERIQTGERPMRVINFASTSAAGETKDEAMLKARQQANELKTVISSTMDTEVTVLGGDDMKKCFEWDYALPNEQQFGDIAY